MARWGVPGGGPADVEAFEVAQRLCGAADGSAGLELTAMGPVLECRGGSCRVAVAAAGEVEAAVERGDGAREALRTPRSVTLHPGDRLHVGAIRATLRAYVAVGGGIGVEAQLGSRNALLRGGTDGLLARGLRTGDELPTGGHDPDGPDLELEPPAWLVDRSPLRITPGPQADRLGAAGRAALEPSAIHRAGTDVDRTGVRLQGTPFGSLRGGADVATQGCPPGALQVTGDGSAILLGVDRGTTGGYAVPAVVASVDLPRLGRIRPGGLVRFQEVEVEAAEVLARARRRLLDSLGEMLRPVA